MKNLILYSLIVVLFLMNAYNFLKPKDELNLNRFRNEYNELKTQIRGLDQEIKNKSLEINSIKYAILQKDSIITNASRNQLDSLFTDFFERVR